MNEKKQIDVLIVVKTYPIPSSKYDELVCTAGVSKAGDFVRLYPINFRDLPFSQQFRKYQWISVIVQKHKGLDARKESYRPDCDSIKINGEPIPTKAKGNWDDRSKYALARQSLSMEHLKEQQEKDRTSLGVFKPKSIKDLVISPDSAEWKPSFKAALAQSRLWETRTVSKEPPRKVPFKFQYLFECEDSKCNGHKMMIEDWEVGALYWRLIDSGASPTEAAEGVKYKFLNELCSDSKDTHFFVGTVLAHPKSWVVIGVYYPRVKKETDRQLGLFS